MSKDNLYALTSDIDTGVIREMQEIVTKNSEAINQIVNQLVADYCRNLDEYVKYINKVIQDQEQPVTAEELDDFVIQLPILLYFAGEAQENLGINEDIAKAKKMEKYNNIYNQVKGTIADKTAKSEIASQTEYLTHIIYNRAYKIVKAKMEAAYELLNSCKKVISRRMAELEIGKVDEGRFKNGRK